MSRATVIVLHGADLDRPDEVDTRLTAEAVLAALGRLGHDAACLHVRDVLATMEDLAAVSPDLVFNLVEAIGGDAARAGEVPAALDRLGLRYTGCNNAATTACLSKLAMKQRMAAAGLPTPAWSLTGAESDCLDRVIVKSDSEHASVGLDAGSVVPGDRAAAEIAARAARHGGVFFAERYVAGREFNLSLMEGAREPEPLPPAEIEFIGYAPDQVRIVDYAAKWLPGSHGYENTPRRFIFGAEDAALIAELGGLARQAWQLFGLTGYARVDFRVDAAGRPWILEVNTNPCLAPDAGFVAAAAEVGIDFDTLVGRLVAIAMTHRTPASDTKAA